MSDFAPSSSFHGPPEFWRITTTPQNINPAGNTKGYYVDDNSVLHGFVRAPDGAFTTFDAPDAGTAPGQVTLPAGADGLNPEGALTGAYINTGSINNGTQVFHGFVRAADGTITGFDAGYVTLNSARYERLLNQFRVGPVILQMQYPQSSVHGSPLARTAGR